MNLPLRAAAVIAAGFLLIVGCKKDKRIEVETLPNCRVENSLVTARTNCNISYDSSNRIVRFNEVSYSYPNDSTILTSVWPGRAILWLLDDMKRVRLGHCLTDNNDTIALYRFIYNSENKLQSATYRDLYGSYFDSVAYKWRDGNMYSATWYTPGTIETFVYDYYPEYTGLQHFGYEPFFGNIGYQVYFVPPPTSYFPQLSCNNMIRNIKKAVFDNKYDTLIVAGYEEPKFDEIGRITEYKSYSIDLYNNDTFKTNTKFDYRCR